MTKDAEIYVRRAMTAGHLDITDIVKLTEFFQKHSGLEVDGMPGPATLKLLNATPKPVESPSVAIPLEVVDRRAFAIQAHGPKREWRVTDRKWSEVTGTCLHQTACILGENPARWDTAGCHIGITRSGKIIWLHDFDREVAHANGFNSQTVGIEVDGLFAGIEGDPKTVWDNPGTAVREVAQSPTDAQIESLKIAVRWIAAEVAAKSGVPMKALVAHRQSSDTRRNDPGSAIWAVAIELMKELKLSDGGPKFKIGDGLPIPEAWDPSRKGIPY